jgi:thioredoxin-related protein
MTSCALNAATFNLDDLAAKAAKQNKHLFVWLHRTGCPYCDAMHEFTIEDDGAVAAMLKKSFIMVEINVSHPDKVIYKSKTYNGKTFALATQYNLYPASLFMDAHDKIVFAALGSIEDKEFLLMLHYVDSNAYETMSLDAYRKKGTGK